MCSNNGSSLIDMFSTELKIDYDWYNDSKKI